MKAMGVIPARWASTRFEGKVLADIAGKPMIQHVWERARKSVCLDQVLIACDDERVLQAAKKFGADVVLVSTEHPDWNGEETITFNVTDPPGLWVTDTATFNVTALNDPPTITDIPDQTIPEGNNFNTFNLDDYVQDPDNPDNPNIQNSRVDLGRIVK